LLLESAPKFEEKSRKHKNLCLEAIYNGQNSKSISYIDLRNEIIRELARLEDLLLQWQNIPRLRKVFEEKIMESLSKNTMKKESSFISFKKTFLESNMVYKKLGTNQLFLTFYNTKP